MTILVTGGAGYIGSHTVYQLIEESHKVVVFDNLSTGHKAAIHPDAQFVKGDLRDQLAIQQVFKAYSDIDGIIHFASHTLVGESTRKPWLYLRDNLQMASNLLECAVEAGVHRIVFSSTSNLFREPDTIPINEQNKISPGSPYGESKSIIERYLHWMDTLYGLKYCALRYFNAAGAHPLGIIGEDHTPETHLIPITLQVALGQREHITIYGNDYDTPDGTCVRDFVHVMDLASAHLLALEALKDGRSRKYNLGNGQGYSVRQIIDVVQNITKKPIKAVDGERRAGDPDILVADSKLITKEVGWNPEFSALESIIQTAWDWHCKNPNGYPNK